MSIKRYEDEVYGPSSYDFEESEFGSWVKYEDHAAEVARLNEQVQAMAAESYRDGLIISRIGDALNHGLFGAAISIVSEVNTKPATDVILNEVRAQVADDLATEFGQIAQSLKKNSVPHRAAKAAVFRCVGAAARIRAGEVPNG